jgi:hypothetical protein
MAAGVAIPTVVMSDSTSDSTEGRPMSAHTIHRNGRAIGLALLLAAVAAACQARDAGTGAGGGPATTPVADSATADQVRQPSVQEILANAQAARSQHDARALQQFRAQLSALLGTAAISEADATYHRVLDDLQSAAAAHDSRSRATFRAQLRALCSPIEPTSILESCDVDLAAAGG